MIGYSLLLRVTCSRVMIPYHQTSANNQHPIEFLFGAPTLFLSRQDPRLQLYLHDQLGFSLTPSPGQVMLFPLIPTNPPYSAVHHRYRAPHCPRGFPKVCQACYRGRSGDGFANAISHRCSDTRAPACPTVTHGVVFTSAETISRPTTLVSTTGSG